MAIKLVLQQFSYGSIKIRAKKLPNKDKWLLKSENRFYVFRLDWMIPLTKD